MLVFPFRRQSVEVGVARRRAGVGPNSSFEERASRFEPALRRYRTCRTPTRITTMRASSDEEIAMKVRRWVAVSLVAGALGATLAGCEDLDMGTSGTGVDDPGPDMAGEETRGPDWAEDDEQEERGANAEME
jgi:hypothetical protein